MPVKRFKFDKKKRTDKRFGRGEMYLPPTDGPSLEQTYALPYFLDADYEHALFVIENLVITTEERLYGVKPRIPATA